MYFQLRYAASRRTARSSRADTRSHSRSKSRAKRRTTSTCSRSGCGSDHDLHERQRDGRDQPIDQHRPGGTPQRATAQRLHQAGQHDRPRPVHLRRAGTACRRTGPPPGPRRRCDPTFAATTRPGPDAGARRRPAGRRPTLPRRRARECSRARASAGTPRPPSAPRARSSTAPRRSCSRDCCVPSPI